MTRLCGFGRETARASIGVAIATQRVSSEGKKVRVKQVGMKLTSLGTSKRMAHLSDDEVLANLGSVIGSRRKITAQLVAYLGEVEARRLHLREACSSMYEFCCRKLKLSEGSAHRHIASARTARSYPIVLDLLPRGTAPRDGTQHAANVFG